MTAGPLGALQRRKVRRRRVATGVVLSLAVSALVVAAIKYDGAPIRDVNLNNGGVWVSNGSKGMMARLNSQVGELDLGVITSTTTEQVFQQASSVQAFDFGKGNPESVVHVVDTLRGQSKKVSLPSTYQVVTGSGVAAIMDDKTGKAWLRRLDQLEAFDENSPADTTLSPRGTVALSKSGTAMFLDRSKGTVVEWGVDVNGKPVKGETFDYDTDSFVDDPSLTVVGETPVVAQEGWVLRPGEDAVKLGKSVVLQEVSEESDDVHVATDEGLFRLDLGGGEAEEISGLDVNGSPALPAVVAGCVHGAWAQSGGDNYARVCDDADPVTAQATGVTEDSQLVFRSNRDVVVLNDVVNGNAWTIQKEGVQLVDNWDSVDPRAKSPQKTELAKEEETHGKNQPPVAVDDSFGARPGSTVILPVTLNDKDPDGDLLTVSGPPGRVGGASFSVVGNGTQVQASVPPDARGTISFEYEITDGRAQNLPSTATVELEVVPSKRDRAPVKLPRQSNKLTVAKGQTASMQVLPAWIDPDGDNLVLAAASSKDGTVNFRPDGTIEFTDDGKGSGRAKVDFELLGGAKSRKASAAVTVVDEADARPIAVADRFTGAVGSTILLEPLKNDSDPGGGEMTVPRMTLPDGETAELDLDSQRGTATFRAVRHGTYYVDYEAAGSNGRIAEPQQIRVDVIPDSDQNLPPVATRDIAVVPADESALVDVLANDTDPDNDVLVLQGIEVPAEYQGLIKASLVEKRFIRVETTRPLEDERPEFEYLLSDGQSDQVKGKVSISPGEAGANRPPVAREDLVVARAGTVLDIPVLDNDEDPDGDKLTVSQGDLEDGDGDAISSGRVPIVATGSSIRVLVPDDGSDELSFNYGIRDPDGLRHDAKVVLSIKPNTAKGNQAPRPRPIVDRAVVGQKIRLAVDSFGSDPDGDSVVFSGVDVPPTLGRIGRTGSNWFEYEPFDDGEQTGTDSFRIKVADGFGKTGVAQVRIGVAPRNEINQPPAALNDQITVKPGLTIRFPVLQNDTDPDGDKLAITPGQFKKGPGVEARVVKDSIEMKAPELAGEPEVTSVAQYAVSDGLGTTSLGLMQVTASEDAPDHAPIAQDDVARPDDFNGRRAGQTIDVDVLANDGDLDGSKADLTLEPMDPTTATVVDRQLRVKLTKKSRVVPYRITDATQQSSFGFVYLPGTATMPPTLNTAAVPIDVVAGQLKEIALEDVVVVRPGRTPRIARVDQVEAAKGDAEAKGEEHFTFKSAKAYHGPASVTFEVLDGEDLNDPKALISQITVPVNVRPATNVDPELRSAEVTVSAGAEPTVLDVSRLARDANPDDELSYVVAEGKDGLDASIDNSGKLEISAEADAPGGTQELALTVKDDKDGKARSTITVEVIPVEDDESAQEAGAADALTLSPLKFPEATLGKVIKVDVAKAILSDPRPKSDKRIAEAKTLSGGASVTSSGTELTITPTKSGTSVVSYLLSAGSGVVARGQVEVTAASTPARPPRPRAEGSGARSVDVSWKAPKDNGRPITSYEVKYAGGSQKCPSTTCTIKNLEPGQNYTFRVSAINELGAGALSPPSNEVRPDKAPGRMTAPRVTSSYKNRNGKLSLAWSPPRQREGSAIVAYEFQASPRTSGRGAVDRRVSAGQRSMEWGSLRNGTNYTFRVRAVNGGGRGFGPWSAPSASAMPFTRPSVMRAPGLRASNNGGVDQAGYLVVSWPAVGAPGNGYDRITRYQVRLLRDGRPFTRVNVDPSRSTRAFKVSNGHTWTASVRAINRAGGGSWSGRSVSQLTWDRAIAPRAARVTSHCFSVPQCRSTYRPYYARLNFNTPARTGGFPVVAYEYATTAGNRYRNNAPTTARNAPVSVRAIFASPRWTHTTPHRIQVTPLTRVPGQAELVRGVPAMAGGFYPWGKPQSPTKAFQGENKVTFNCDKGNGRKVNANTISKSDGGTKTVVNGPRGCSRVSYKWSNIPKGSRRCVTIRVQHKYAQSVNKKLCTLRKK